MERNFLYPYVLIALWLSGFDLTGQSNHQVKFEHLVIQEGLSHNWAKCINKDSRGFLWVGTINGLNRYDGKTFKVFKSDPTDDSSISDNFIQAIEEDKNGDLWVGTYSGGINKYDKYNQTFRAFRNMPKNPYSISDDRIYSILSDSRGQLWVGTEKGLDRYNFEEERFYHFLFFEPGQEMIRGVINHVYEDSQGRLWAASAHGLYKIDFEHKTVVKYNHHSTDRHTIAHDHTTRVYEDEFGHVWVGTLGGGLNFYNEATQQFTRYSTEEPKRTINHNSVLALTGDKAGHLYIGTEGGGLSIMDLQSRMIRSFIPNADQPKSINSNSVHSIYYDDETRVTWVGTYHGGLNYFSSWDKPFIHYSSQNGPLNNNNILCITEDQAGNIIVGTDGGGVNIIDVETGRARFITHQENKKTGILSNAVLAVLIDRSDNLWVGSFNGGLDYIPSGSNRVIHYQHDPDDANSISNNDVSAIYEDRFGMIWIGTMKGGLNRLDPASGVITRFQRADNSPSSITDNFISKVFEDHLGRLMIQTGKSLDIFDREQGVFQRFGIDYGVELDMPIASLEDSRNNLWISGREQLFYFNTTDKSYRTYTMADGLPSNNVVGILEDEDQNLWLSTMKGLVKAIDAVEKPDSLNLQVFTPAEGLQGLNFTEQACYKNRAGWLYFGGQNGFNVFDPKDILINPVAPPVVLNSFKLFNKEVAVGGEILPRPVNELDEISLSYKNNVISFGFAALNYILPEKNQYAYKMEGFENQWNYVGNTTNATYTNLDPGTYTFRVKASNNDGIWNQEGTAIKIRILPPWWNTLWFKILVGTLLIAGIVGYFRIRLHILHTRQKILKNQVREATLEIQHVNELLADRNKEIEHQNASLLEKNDQLTVQNHELENQSNKIQQLLKEIQELTEMKLRFFTNISHELRTPLTLILGPLENLLIKNSEQLTLQKEFTVMHRNASKLLQLINQLLDFRKIESGNLGLLASNGDIVAFTREIFDSFSLMADRRHIDYQFHATEEAIELWFDHEKMEKIVTNLLSNAFKFTPANETIRVSIHAHQESVEMEFSDTGSGIPEEQKEHIFDLYYQARNSQNLKQAGTGIGLALIKQFVELHHGAIAVQSEPEKGTTFTLTFKKGKDHLAMEELSDSSGAYELKLKPSFMPEPVAEEPEVEPVTHPELWEELMEEKPVLLVVEDNDDIRRYISDVFSGRFLLLEAENGEEGLEKAFDSIPDIIISDIMMPKMNGFQMCQQLKQDERTSHIPTILLTAYSEEKKQSDGFASGADDYITKPFNAGILQQKILNIMQTRHNLMEKFRDQSTLEFSALAAKAEDQRFMRKALEVIEANLTVVNFGVEDFSHEFNMSRRNLLRKIKGITGLSVTEFIKNIRLKKSIQLLHNQEMNVSEVAYAVGFNDPKYFSKCFREQFGKSPSEYVAAINDDRIDWMSKT